MLQSQNKTKPKKKKIMQCYSTSRGQKELFDKYTVASDKHTLTNVHNTLKYHTLNRHGKRKGTFMCTKHASDNLNTSVVIKRSSS